MLWEVSGFMYFDLLERRNFFANKIYAWIEKAFLSQSGGGDFIFPRYIKDYGDGEPPAGPYKLAWRLRVEAEADKQSMVSYYWNHVEEEINKTIPGYLKGHKCFHDVRKSCQEDLEITEDEW